MELVELMKTRSTPDARLLEAVLIDHGLDPVVLQADLANTLGVGAFLVPARVMVPADQEAEARTVMAVIEASQTIVPEGDPETCPGCGEPWEPGFDECWSCQAPRPT